MKGKKDCRRFVASILFLMICTFAARGYTLRGKVVDAATGEPLVGATVQVSGRSLGTAADAEGRYELTLGSGVYTIVVRYIGYTDATFDNVAVGQADVTLDVSLSAGGTSLEEVTITRRANREGERALLAERQMSGVAIENIGAREMSVKGIGNVQEGVKKITGISVATAGQLIVRGLGDRYSTTTLNGMPIASPNPDNKLIPLDIFPTNTVQNITVSKVYEAEAFADYSGAHIDISTKDNVVEDFFSVSFNVGGALNTIGKSFYQMDRDGSLLKTPSMDQAALEMTLTEFDEYVTTKDIFNTSFDVKKKSWMPDMSGNLGFGRNFRVGNQTLSVLLAGSMSNGYQKVTNAYYKTLEATGNEQNYFSYNSFTQTLNVAALANVSYTLREMDRISYTLFYARNATDTYQLREGVDSESHSLTGSNNVTHIYSLVNHQIHGSHYFGDARQWQLTWGGSFSGTGSDEPDRRQVMYVHNEDGTTTLFKLNRQETMRYYGELDEDEWNANAALRWKWSGENTVKLGFNYKNKDRDYTGTRFYYNVNKIYDEITDIYTPSTYINQDAVETGTVVIERKMQPKDSYKAGNDIYAGFITTDFYPAPPLLVTVGVRYEYSKQWVNYATDGGEKYAERRDMNQGDIFPALNLKYSFGQDNILRFSASRTVTRPSFIEMAPFLYQESYGSAQIRGNAELENGYNYNFDLRYERFGGNGDMISATGYFKYLDSPIERVQSVSGGATVHTFQNADNGLAAGIEVEGRAQIVHDLRLAANVSYMYTNVKLPESGAYTTKERSLQGASPILANVDLTYSPKLGGDSQIDIALLYNLQGSRIHAVGVSGLGDVKQQAIHTVNLNITYTLSSHFSVKAQANDLLNRAVVFKQDVPTTGEKIEVERYKKGTNFEIGITYKL